MLRSLVCSVLCVAVLVFVVAQIVRIIVFPTALVGPLPRPRGSTELVTTRRGDSVEVLRCGERKAGTPIVVWSHGNGEGVGRRLEMALKRSSDATGLQIVTYDYPGYGVSTGVPTEASVNETLRAVVEHLQVPDGDVILVGQSVGSGPTVAYAAEHPGLRGVVLMCPFLSVTRVKLPFSVPWVDFFRSYKVAPSIRCPVHIVGAEQDEVVPAAHSIALHGLIPHATLKMTACGHNEVVCDPTLVELSQDC